MAKLTRRAAPAGDPATILQSCLSPASFWAPGQLAPASAWLEHAPFAFWLVEALRPRTFVELGTYGGYSYFAFCQAVQRLSLDTRCYAVDTWKGDEHAGYYGEEVYEQVSTHNSVHYSSFSALIRASFDEAAGHFTNGSIDLLHIDGRHFYEDVRHDFELWHPKLSDRSIVVFHDTNVREGTFGVSQLWLELSSDHPSFEFLHGHGLGILGVGSRLPSKLTRLFQAAHDERATVHIRNAYGRLGSAISLKVISDAQIATRSAEAQHLQRELGQFHTQTGAALEQASVNRRELLAENEQLRASGAELTQVQGQLTQVRGELTRAQEEGFRLQTKLAQNVTNTELLRVALEGATTRSEQLEVTIQELSEQLNHVRAQLSTTESRSASLEEQLKAKSVELSRLETDLADARGRSAELAKELGVQSRRLNSLRASTSWRITRPLRWAGHRFPRAARQLRRAGKLIGWSLTFQPFYTGSCRLQATAQYRPDRLLRPIRSRLVPRALLRCAYCWRLSCNALSSFRS